MNMVIEIEVDFIVILIENAYKIVMLLEAFKTFSTKKKLFCLGIRCDACER